MLVIFLCRARLVKRQEWLARIHSVQQETIQTAEGWRGCIRSGFPVPLSQSGRGAALKAKIVQKTRDLLAETNVTARSATADFSPNSEWWRRRELNPRP